MAIVVVALVQWLARGIRTGDRFQVLARCADGHVFRTMWLPLFLLPVPRVGLVAFRYCPVGRHWSVVVPIGRR
jgi:hypothetical protein